MLSSRLAFFLYILTLLFAGLLCLPWTATAQFNQPRLISLPIQEFVPNAFIVYGRAPTQEDAGIANGVQYRQTTETLPNLKTFFEFGGTLELLTTTLFFSTHDIVISEIMWGLDTGYPLDIHDTYTQWIELYNPHVGAHITVPLFLLFTPFENYPDRDIVELPNGVQARVLDAVSNLHLGRWNLPGRSGKRPSSSVISAYRDIVYPEGGTGRSDVPFGSYKESWKATAVSNLHLGRWNLPGRSGKRPSSSVISAYRDIVYPEGGTGRSDVPFGSYKESWKATVAHGRRNTLLSTIDDRDRMIALPYIATPGAPHVPDTFLLPLSKTVVRSDRVVINEIRNDISRDNLDWVELKNVSRLSVDLENWELSIVTGVGADTDLVNLPRYTLDPGEILLLQRRHPKFTDLADGIHIGNFDEPKNRGAAHKYFVDPGLDFPNTGQFVVLLRSESDKNGQDAAIEDYAGNGFFLDTSTEFNTEFWPRKGQPRPTDVASFGNYSSFGSLDSAWARLRYQRDDGHHKDAWEIVGTQGGIGYAPEADRSVSPGTPGYENDALRTRIDDRDFRTPITSREYNTGEITISEIMSDGGPQQNKAQWIELYNSSLTQAVNLEGWEIEVRNATDDVGVYVDGSFIFNKAIILPNQTLLLVSKSDRNNVLTNRVYDLYHYHQKELALNRRQSTLLSSTGFYIKLTDKGNPERDSDDIVVDEAGNIEVDGDTRAKKWDLPPRRSELRQSLVRQYGELFKPNQGGQDGKPNAAKIGTDKDAWRQANRHYVSLTYYGDSNDKGTPGHRLGSPLPVQLSSFRPERTATGAVVINWITESELNNVGFNLLRSETREGEFQVINPTLITGAGTTSEQQSYDFTDTIAKPNAVYYYRIEDVSLDGVRRTLVTVRLKGQVSATDKLTTTWGHLKTQN